MSNEFQKFILRDAKEEGKEKVPLKRGKDKPDKKDESKKKS